MRRFLLVLALLFMPLLARAQGTQTVIPGVTTTIGCPSGQAKCFQALPSTGIVFAGATVGASHAQVLAANLVFAYLMLHNPSAAGGNTVYCSFGGTATVAGAGTLSIAPGQYVTFESNSLSTKAIDCIASGANTPLTIGTN